MGGWVGVVGSNIERWSLLWVLVDGWPRVVGSISERPCHAVTISGFFWSAKFFQMRSAPSSRRREEVGDADGNRQESQVEASHFWWTEMCGKMKTFNSHSLKTCNTDFENTSKDTRVQKSYFKRPVSPASILWVRNKTRRESNHKKALQLRAKYKTCPRTLVRKLLQPVKASTWFMFRVLLF